MLDRLKPTATGLDMLRAWFLRLSAPAITATLTLLFNQSIRCAVAHPSPASSLKVTDRSFQYASPHLWNKLPFSLPEPISPPYAYLNPSFSFSAFPIHHPFTLSLFHSKLTFLVNLFRHKSLTIDISDWLPRLMGPFSVFTVFVGVISCSWCGRQN